LVRMLSKLAQHAEQGTPEARPQADEALREQVRDLLQGWTLEDPNPDAYGLALQKMAAAAPHTAARRVGEQAAEPLRIVQTAVESGALGFGAWRAVERLVAEHHVSELVDLLAESPDASRPALRADIAPLWTRVTSPDVIRQLASTEPPDFVTLDRVFPHLRVDAFEPLLDVLGASESRTARSADPRPARAWPRHSHAPVARPPLVCHAQFVADPRRAAGAPRRVLDGGFHRS